MPNRAPASRELAAPAVQVELVDRSKPVQQDSDEHEQRALREAVTDHVRGDPATPCAVRNPIPHTNTPMWLIVENASSRFRWRCA